MLKTIKHLGISAFTIIGASALATVPASAYSISGNNDYLLYDVCPPNYTCLNPNANLDSILAGNSSSPGGNVELFASSEQVNLANFLNSTARTSVEGTVAGKSLTVSSLTATDWFGSNLNTAYSANTFATNWFDQFYNNAGLASKEAQIKTALGLPSFIPSSVIRTGVYEAFKSDLVKGFQRSSDPNISYITTSGSDLLIGLAGHYDAKAFYAPLLGPFASFINDGFQVSETVKVKYGDVEKLLYSFSATQSGLVNNAGQGADGRSHTGNYEVKLEGVVPPASVPEPSTMLGLMAVGGMVVASKRKAN